MSNTAMVEKYRSNFLKEVAENVEEGEWVRMCMQCGVCSGSCPMGPHWEHPPQELFMMIRANKREEVLSSSSMWMCTSCYNCIARCPRELPITHIMHGLAHYAKRLGLAPKENPTNKFSQRFWDNLTKTGRVNELKLGLSLYFMNGFVEGIKTALKMKDVGMGMLKTGRMNPLEILGGHGVKDKSGFQAMLKKAQELEAARVDK
ncbi:4Fe-4S dicluster domain-containing protein [Candidatus Venteria ishoeyi]|uniref:Succinate dehydrogenase iron-sulfur subunit n=1 Tax=Candidatus Venteria ishoeyi TaxID=1899563 RepID=A0A1H6F361_9GAMM|nr:4Fe-4S dicluster domain-containing protein [Candidatus Venteria ishoeyi]MDM8547700.1 4Fe-4S dicluster domain-containing protein [Candidatus Venteria ishoeyi]SEH04512.1 succinate dehydrogenase iron-sulfur subunit [Candidatus Venteria ishoeyi]